MSWYDPLIWLLNRPQQSLFQGIDAAFRNWLAGLLQGNSQEVA